MDRQASKGKYKLYGKTGNLKNVCRANYSLHHVTTLCNAIYIKKILNLLF